MSLGFHGTQWQNPNEPDQKVEGYWETAGNQTLDAYFYSSLILK